VKVDLQTWTHQARLLMAQPGSGINGAVPTVVDALSAELLPAWSDEWLIFERQRWDQLRLHALEQLAERFASAGMYMDSVEAALAAVAIEPYRESANRVLIRAYIAEGNQASAVAQYHRYQRILTRELGVRPTAQLQRLVHGLTEEQAPR
jgi:DNA-binding SARP family transcriptional activator